MPATFTGTFTRNDEGEYIPGDDVVFTPPAAHELLISVRDLIRDNPDRHDQGSWVNNVFYGPVGGDVASMVKYAGSAIPDEPENPDNPVCGTKACVAGWGVIMGSAPGTRLLRGGIVFFPGETSRTSDGHDIQEVAGDLLGLDYHQSQWLFSGDRTRDEVLTALNELIEDPYAEIYREKMTTLTVTVTDENGNHLYSAPVEVEESETEYYQVEDALRKARNEH